MASEQTIILPLVRTVSAPNVKGLALIHLENFGLFAEKAFLPMSS